ncbi:MAG: M55 family metallopeptidase [Nocardioides sp.]
MRIYLSTDMEGTAGIVDWDQCRGPGRAYEEGRTLLLDEVNAAIDGALEAGATHVLVNDSHSTMANLPPGSLHGDASYLSGRHKPRYMMEGLDETFDAVLFVSYHGSMDSQGVLSHTYNPRAIASVRIGGTTAGEAGINALVAAAYGVPVALVTGDQTVGPEAEPFCPGIEVVEVKRSVTRFAAESLHPSVACDRIRAGARTAVARAADLAPPSFAHPVGLEVDFLTADMAEMATWVNEVERVASRSVRITDAEPLAAYRTFIALVALTRSIVE